MSAEWTGGVSSGRVPRSAAWRRRAARSAAFFGALAFLFLGPLSGDRPTTPVAAAGEITHALAQDAGTNSRQDSGDPAPKSNDGAPAPAVKPGDSKEKAEKKPTGPQPPQLEDLPFGETLVYRGRVKKAGLSFEAGRATLRVKMDREANPVLEARAFGEKFGYRMNTRITSTLDPITLRPEQHFTAERGTERRTKKVVFLDDGADFIRLKHCKDPDCKDPSHKVKQAKMHGPIPWGTEHVHCKDRDCKHRSHYDWRVRSEHRYEGTYVDLLSAIYLARQIEFDPNAEPIVLPIVNDTRRWNVRVRAKKQKKITVKAGTFDAVQLLLEPLPGDLGEEKEKFKGLFGLNGTIQIWVDRTTRRPILIEGTLPFAFLDLHAQVELIEITENADIAAAAKKRGIGTPKAGVATAGSSSDAAPEKASGTTDDR